MTDLKRSLGIGFKGQQSWQRVGGLKQKAVVCGLWGAIKADGQGDYETKIGGLGG